MDVLTYVLDGLEKELELERELGVRTVEIDRALLTAPSVGASTAVAPASAPAREPLPSAKSVPPAVKPASREDCDFVFLHHRPLGAEAIEMMAKIIAAMGKDATTAPIAIEPPLPAAKVYVVLGARALEKFLPGTRGEPGMWVKTAEGKAALITYSPEFFLRFPAVTPAVRKMKQDMWRSLKAVMQRVRSMA